jgi:hypothetical protein
MEEGGDAICDLLTIGDVITPFPGDQYGLNVVDVWTFGFRLRKGIKSIPIRVCRLSRDDPWKYLVYSPDIRAVVTAIDKKNPLGQTMLNCINGASLDSTTFDDKVWKIHLGIEAILFDFWPSYLSMSNKKYNGDKKGLCALMTPMGMLRIASEDMNVDMILRTIHREIAIVGTYALGWDQFSATHFPWIINSMAMKHMISEDEARRRFHDVVASVTKISHFSKVYHMVIECIPDDASEEIKNRGMYVAYTLIAYSSHTLLYPHKLSMVKPDRIPRFISRKRA